MTELISYKYCKQQMSQYHIYCVYKVALNNWYTTLRSKRPSFQYAPQFLECLQDNLNLCISCDARIVPYIYFLLLHANTIELKRKYLYNIVHELDKMQFISYRHCQQLLDLEDTTIGEHACKFLAAVDDQEVFDPHSLKKAETIQKMWNQSMDIGLELYWQLVKLHSVQHPILLKLLQITSVCPEVSSNKSLISLKEKLIKAYNSIGTFISLAQPDRQVRQPALDRSQLVSYSRFERDLEMQPRPEQKSFDESYYQIEQSMGRLAFEPSEIQEDQYIQPRQHPVVSISKSQIKRQKQEEEQKEEQKVMARSPFAYLKRVQKEEVYEQKIQIMLTKTALKNSLFYNPMNASIVNALMNKFLPAFIDRFSFNEHFQLQPFGSLRSKLALVNDYDIDLTYVHQFDVLSKRHAIGELYRYKHKILEEFQFEWVYKAYVMDKQNLPPLLTVCCNKEIFRLQYNLQNIHKIDLTMNNDKAAVNSEFLSHFAEVPEVLLFCLLVKLWAKNNNVINSRKPMEGIHGYGVILMCLYFLMETSQINFLTFTEEQLKRIYIGSLIPKIDKCDFNGLVWNFIEFLNFYKKGGPFHTQKKIVCLLKNSEKAIRYYNPNLVINMYDFIDDTNPGRLTLDHQDTFFNTLDMSYNIMESGDLTAIGNLFRPR